jgi:F-type H+-transporting ATPase subunit b
MNNPLVQPDPGLFIWTIITFLVLLALLAKFAWKPLLAALEARRETIRKSLDDAQQAKVELEKLHQESAQILRQARIDAAAIVSQSRSDAQSLREELNKKSQAEAEGIVKNAQKVIQIETQAALAHIRREAVDLSVTIASKLLERNVSKEDNSRLIDETLRQIEETTKQG